MSAASSIAASKIVRLRNRFRQTGMDVCGFAFMETGEFLLTAEELEVIESRSGRIPQES